MKLFPVTMIIFGAILIAFPDIIAYLIGGVCVVAGVQMLVFQLFFRTKKSDDGYVKFGKYKIYR